MSSVVVFTAFLTHGEVHATINNIEYIYFIDGGHMEYIERLARRTPWKTVNFLKQHHKGYIKEGVYHDSKNIGI